MTKRHGSSEFRFAAPQGRIDWALLDRMDPPRLAREVDLDALEEALPSVAHGNLRKYAAGEASPAALRRLFEVSQLAVQYLLYVQDRLAGDVRKAKAQAEAAQAEAGALRAALTEARQETEAAEREARHTRRMLRVALAQAVPPAAPAPAPLAAPQADPAAPSAAPEAAADRLKKLEEGIIELLKWKTEAAAARPHEARGEAVDVPPGAAASTPPLPPPPPPAEAREDANPAFTHLSRSTLNVAGPSVPRARSPSPPAAAPPAPSPPRSPAVPHRQFLAELPCEATGHDRPGVRSRFPHSLADLRAVRQELQAELEAELAAELAAQGVHDPEGCRGLTPAEYMACTEALRARREAAARQMSAADRAREHYMRSTVSSHVDAVSKSVAAARRQPPRAQPVPQPPGPSPAPSPGPAPVEAALADFGADEEADAFYSPLRKGTHSQPGTPGTPGSAAARLPSLI